MLARRRTSYDACVFQVTSRLTDAYLIHDLVQFNSDSIFFPFCWCLELIIDDMNCQAINYFCFCTLFCAFLTNQLAANEAQACIPPRYKVRPLKEDDDLLTKNDGIGMILNPVLSCLIFFAWMICRLYSLYLSFLFLRS